MPRTVKTEDSWFDGGKIKNEHIEDFINAYYEAGYTSDQLEKKIDKGVWNKYQNILNQRTINSAAENLENPKVVIESGGVRVEGTPKTKVPDFDYGSGKTTIGDIANALYGDNANDHMESLAKKLVGKSKVAPDTDYSQYKVDLGSKEYRTIGRYIANNQDDLSQGVLGSTNNGGTEFKLNTGVFENLSQEYRDDVTGSYGESSKFAGQRKKVMKTLSDFEDKYGVRASQENNVINKISDSKFTSIMDKLKDNKVLTKDEVEYFNEVKGIYNEVKGELSNVVSEEGIDLNNANIFGKPKLTEKTIDYTRNGKQNSFKVNDYDYSGNSDVTKMAKRSQIYKSLSKAEELGIEKYDVNDDGTFKKINTETGKTENPNEKLLKDVDNSNDFKTISNDYKGKIEKELENDFQRDVVQNSNITNPDYINMKRDYYYEENVGRYTDKILESDNKAFYGDKNAENLYKLKKNGVSLNEGDEKILQDYAIAYQGGIKDTDDVITNLKKASSNAFNEYGINANNIDYINTKEGFKLLRDDNGKVTIDESSLDDDVKNSKEYIDNYKGKVIDGETDLSGLARMNATAKRKRNIGGDTSYDDFLKDAEKEISEMKDAESGFGLNRREQLEKMGISSDNAKKLDEAMKDGGSLNKDSLLDAIEDYKNNRNKKLSVGEIEFDGLSQKQLQEILQKNGIGNLSGLSEKELRDKAADLFDIKNTNGRLGTGMKYHMTGRKIDSAQAVKDFYNDIIDGGEINLEKLKGVFSVENKNQIGTLGELVKESMSGKSIDEIARDKKRDSALGTVYDAIIGAMDKYGDGLSSEEKDKVNKLAKKFKDRKFSEDELKKLDGIIDDVSDFKEKFESIKGSEFASKAKDVLGNKTFKGVAGVAAAIGGIGLVANAVSKASEERERKRQEMNQLIAMQSSSLRGGY